MFFSSNTPKNSRSAALKIFFHKRSIHPFTQGDGRPFYLWRVEKEHLRVQLQWVQEMPRGRFFCWRYWLPVEGWSFITLQLVSFQASCRGEKTAFNSTIQTPKFFFFGTYIIKGFLELNPVWLVKCRYDEKAGWGYPDATNSSRIFKRKVYKKSFKVLPSCSMFDQQRPGVSTRFEVCVCVCCNWGVLLRLVFYVGGLRPSLSQKTKKSRE